MKISLGAALRIGGVSGELVKAYRIVFMCVWLPKGISTNALTGCCHFTIPPETHRSRFFLNLEHIASERAFLFVHVYINRHT